MAKLSGFNWWFLSNKKITYLIKIGLCLFVFGAWLAARPYNGIWHDSILYTAQALNHLHPGILDGDLFFRYGSQDQFTIFPAVHAKMIGIFGIEAAARNLTVFGKVLWFLGCTYFLSAFLSGRAFWLGLAIATSYSPYIDSHGVFSYGESFVTSRIFAEACVFLALALLLRNKTPWAAASLLLGLLLHPLVAIPGIVVLLIVKYLQTDKKKEALLVAAFLALIGLLLAFSGIAPFDRLLAVYDMEWLAIVERRNAYIFLDTWTTSAYSRIAFITALLVGSCMFHVGKQRQMALSGVLTLVLLLPLAWFGSSIFHNVLITQLQLWRALWLVQLLAWALMGELIVTLVKGKPAQQLLLAFFVSAFLLDGVGSGILSIMALLLYWLIDKKLPDWQPSSLTILVAVAMLLISLVFKLASLEFLIKVWSISNKQVWQPLMFDMLTVVGFVALATWHLARHQWVVAGVFPLGLAVFIIGAQAFVDEKSLLQDYDEASLAQLRKLIPPHATVFYPGSLTYNWLLLQRPNYASGLQAAGVLFSRATAIEANRRQGLLWSAGFKDGNPYWPGLEESTAALSRIPKAMPENKAVEWLCRDTELDYLILPRDETGAVANLYRPLFEDKKFRLFECDTTRAYSRKPAVG